MPTKIRRESEWNEMKNKTKTQSRLAQFDREG